MAMVLEKIYPGTEEPITEEDLLEFRLLYQGEIKSSGNESKPEAVHTIRKVLHPQLRRQWEINSALRQLAIFSGDEISRAGLEALQTEQGRFEHGIRSLGRQRMNFGFQFIPLVTEDHSVRCSIDILLLRPGDKRLILSQGDIDGQVKTICDALRIIKNQKEVVSPPEQDEEPFFCLLEDDRLISEVRVTADELLLLPSERNVKPNDAFAVIHVKTNAKYPGSLGNWLA